MEIIWHFFNAPVVRATQRQVSENICSKDDLRSRIFGTFVVKCLACLPLLRFSNIYKNGVLANFNGYVPWKGHLEFSRALFLAEIFEKVRFDPYNFPITSFSARKSEQIKNFGGINRYLYLPLRYQNTFNLLCLSGFELYYRWVLLGYVCGGIMIFFKSHFKDQIKEFTLW